MTAPWTNDAWHVDAMELRGTVREALPNAMFRVALDNGHRILAHVDGMMRHYDVRLVSGDRVAVNVSPHDLRRGRITHRMK